MLTFAISVLFGLVAFAALAQIYASVSHGVRRARLIAAELARQPRPLLRSDRPAMARFATA